MTRDFFKVNMLADIVNLREKSIPECFPNSLGHRSPHWCFPGPHTIPPSCTCDIFPAGASGAKNCLLWSLLHTGLRASFPHKTLFPSCCSTQRGRRSNTHRRKSKYSSRYSRHILWPECTHLRLFQPWVCKSSYCTTDMSFSWYSSWEGNNLDPAACLSSIDPFSKDQAAQVQVHSLKPTTITGAQ